MSKIQTCILLNFIKHKKKKYLFESYSKNIKTLSLSLVNFYNQLKIVNTIYQTFGVHNLVCHMLQSQLSLSYVTILKRFEWRDLKTWSQSLKLAWISQANKANRLYSYPAYQFLSLMSERKNMSEREKRNKQNIHWKDMSPSIISFEHNWIQSPLQITYVTIMSLILPKVLIIHTMF